MKRLTRLPASSLIATLILALILFISCSLLLSGLYYFKYFQTRDTIDERLDDDLLSGINIVLSGNRFSENTYSDSLLLFKDSPDSLYYTSALWGIFPGTTLRVAYKGRHKNKQFLSGAMQYPYADATLYLVDHDQPLSLVGETLIEGKAYLPKSGIRSGFFEQRGFSREKIIEGVTDSSKKQLPTIAAAIQNQVKAIAGFIKDSAANAAFVTGNALQSFSGDTRILKTNRWGILSNRTLSGRIIVVSDSVIEADRTSQLTDVILVAPFIHFKDGFAGAVQAFALDSITIDAGCYLKYPSALVGMGRQDALSNTGATVTALDGSVVEGVIMALAGTAGSNIKPVVKIKKGAAIKGLVYNNGYTYLNGKVEGAVFTDFFFEQRGPLSMENIIIDASVTKSKWLTEAYYGAVFETSSNRQIIKWLY
ncbi:MAG: hypothetical protein QM640_05535 [Niabella sp.]